jgi:hypothetical protein
MASRAQHSQATVPEAAIGRLEAFVADLGARRRPSWAATTPQTR